MDKKDERFAPSSLFYVLTDVTKNSVGYFNDENKRTQVDKSHFLNIWTGITLLTEKKENSIEPNFDKKLKEQKVGNALAVLASACIIMWAVTGLSKASSISIASIFFIALVLAGLGISTLLLWYEMDTYNPTLQKFCSGGKKMSCDAVINSKHAKVLSKGISLSSLSFSHFFASFMLMLIFSFSISTFNFLEVLSLFGIPVMAYSIYFQMAVIKKWCKFCLMVIGVLALQVTITAVVGIEMVSFWDYLPAFMAFFSMPILGWNWLRTLLSDKKGVHLYKRSLGKIKNNPAVLQVLLSKSRKIETSPKGLGIMLKTEKPKYHVLKVCNPYCGPCAKAHPVLETLHKKGIIDLQVLFTAAPDKADPKTVPVSHLLAIAGNENQKTTQQALDNWYLADKKDYERFAQQYPMNGELEQQWLKIEAMHQWCQAENITHTPTIFINGHELPIEYSVNDLLEVLV
ncbi:thioredoxin domain-containing protein [Galbibacter sp. EGI 63066]|uniref:vitamin K epoxide reductase family protein n=1 Tax=Galbibacter sp. EGI 63066 TaxID=2993559 RepID=UPI00224908D5|nr:vitamin K epoxide reductase family protein [Galbibacter sp. EGI 63066]MCX2682114.1 thioredoxin domain-containing protein [Galbibacter sp. EGI 63066]